MNVKDSVKLGLAAAALLTTTLMPTAAFAHPKEDDIYDNDTTSDPGGKVNICHRTGSDSNPYVLINVSENSARYKGHKMHADEPEHWKNGRYDIIDGYNGTVKNADDCPKAPSGEVPFAPLAAAYPAVGAASFGAFYLMRRRRSDA